MKKRYLSLIFAFLMLVPGLLLLTACGGKKVSNIYVENMFVGDAKWEYGYGTQINDIISFDNIKVTATYTDNSTKVLEANEYTIQYYKDNNLIENINDMPDVGYYTIYVTHENIGNGTSFNVVPTYKNSPYTLNLSKKTWTCGDELPVVSLNDDIKEGEKVDYKYIEKSVYDNMTEDEKLYIDGPSFTDAQMHIQAGQYYIFGEITFATASNYKGTRIDENCLVTVNA